MLEGNRLLRFRASYFFEGESNIADIHDFITILEKKLKEKLKILNFRDIILHSEPLLGRTDGIIF